MRDIEGLLLLTALTPSSPDLQKLVAFENAFDRIFGIIDSEGALTHGGIIVQDCLSLLANLLRLNVSNQSYFRETGWVKKLGGLLGEAIREQDLPDSVADWAKPQRDKNVWGLLAVLQLFLVKGSVGTQANQVSFWQSGILNHVLDIAFRESFDVPIRAEVSYCLLTNILGLTKPTKGTCHSRGSHKIEHCFAGRFCTARRSFSSTRRGTAGEWSSQWQSSSIKGQRHIWSP